MSEKISLDSSEEIKKLFFEKVINTPYKIR